MRRIEVLDNSDVHSSTVRKGDSWGKREIIVDVAREHIVVAKRFKNGSPKIMTKRVVRIDDKKK